MQTDGGDALRQRTPDELIFVIPKITSWLAYSYQKKCPNHNKKNELSLFVVRAFRAEVARFYI